MLDPEGQQKITQACGGASVMRGGTGGVQRKVKDTCGNAYYIHCYAHQLNLVMQHPTDQSLFFRYFHNISLFLLFCQVVQESRSA